MIKLVFISVLLLSVMSCKNDRNSNSINNKETKKEIVKDLDYYLINGIDNLDNYAGVEQKFSEAVYLRGFGFFEKAVNRYDLIIELQNDISNSVVSKLTFAVEGIITEYEKENLSDYAKSKKRMYEAWYVSKPKLINKNNHRYVIIDVTTKLKELKLMKFYLYDGNGYKGDIGSRILYEDYWIK